MEYIANYGWVVLVAIIVIIALHKYGIFDIGESAVQGFAAFDDPVFRVLDYKAANHLVGGSNVVLVVFNNHVQNCQIIQGDIILTGEDGVACTAVKENDVPASGDTVLLLRGEEGIWEWNCPQIIGASRGSAWMANFEMEYQAQNDQVRHTLRGALKAKLE